MQENQIDLLTEAIQLNINSSEEATAIMDKDIRLDFFNF